MKLKRSFCFLLAMLLILTCMPLSSQAKKTVIRLNKKTVSVYTGKTVKLKVKGTTKKVKWSSSNKKIATVSKKGVVKGKKAGSCKVFAKVAGVKLKCKVTVKSSAGTPVNPTEPKAKAKRTILMYTAGSDLEADDGNLTKNLMNAMSANISDDVNFILMTGATGRSFMKKKYAVDKNGKKVGIAPTNKQIWCLTGTDENSEGKMTLLKDYGDFANKTYVCGNSVKQLINFGAKYYPAEKYDLILWGHGFGVGGFGDGDSQSDNNISLVDLKNAIKSSSVKQLELLDFDACVMGNTEVLMTLSSVAENFVVSADGEPASGQEYAGWLNMLSANPDVDGYALAKKIVDEYYAKYNVVDDPVRNSGSLAVLAAVKADQFVEKVTPALVDLTNTLVSEATKKGTNNRYNFYDEILSANHSVQYINSGVSNIDLGNFAEALGVCVSETDTASDAATYKNAYTEASAKIKAVFNDSDIIYTKNSPMHDHKVTKIGRDSSGTATFTDTVSPNGIGITFPFYGSFDVAAYNKSISVLIDDISRENSILARDEVVVMENLQNIAGLYKSVFTAGKSISSLSEQGAGLTEKAIKDNMMIDYEYDTAWLSEIINQQKAEIISKSNMSVTEEGGSNKIKVTGAAVKILPFEKFLRYENTIQNETNKDEKKTDLVLGSDYAVTSGTGGINAAVSMYKNKEVSLTAPVLDKKWHALIDNEGKSHIISFEKYEGAENIYDVLLLIDKFTYDDEGNAYPMDERLRVSVEKKNGQEAVIKKIQVVTWGSEYDFPTNDKKETFTDLYTASGDIYFDMSKFNSKQKVAYDMNKANLGLSIKSDVDIKTIDNVTTEMYNSLSRRWVITDIYGVSHTIKF